MKKNVQETKCTSLEHEGGRMAGNLPAD